MYSMEIPTSAFRVDRGENTYFVWQEMGEIVVYHEQLDYLYFSGEVSLMYPADKAACIQTYEQHFSPV